MARAGGWSWGLLRRPGSHQGRQGVRRSSSVPSVTESKRRHRRRRAAAVLRVPRARIRDPRQDPGNHARWPRWWTRCGAPAPRGWSGLSIPVPSAPSPSPCAALGAGRAGSQEGEIPFSPSIPELGFSGCKIGPNIFPLKGFTNAFVYMSVLKFVPGINAVYLVLIKIAP